jgi:hypothetical protein
MGFLATFPGPAEDEAASRQRKQAQLKVRVRPAACLGTALPACAPLPAAPCEARAAGVLSQADLRIQIEGNKRRKEAEARR